MTLPSGVFVAQTAGVPVDFRVVSGDKMRSFPGCTAAAQRGVPLNYSNSPIVNGVAPAVSTGAQVLAGILGDVVVDMSTTDPNVSNNVWGMGAFTYTEIGQTVSVWQLGEFYVKNVSGTVNAGDFLQPTTNGNWVSSTTINNIQNGAVVCTVGNGGTAGAPIQLRINVA